MKKNPSKQLFKHILTKFQINRTFLESVVKKTYTTVLQKKLSIRMDFSTLTFNISESKILPPGDFSVRCSPNCLLYSYQVSDRKLKK